jgi:hypothetical protein
LKIRRAIHGCPQHQKYPKPSYAKSRPSRKKADRVLPEGSEEATKHGRGAHRDRVLSTGAGPTAAHLTNPAHHYQTSVSRNPWPAILREERRRPWYGDAGTRDDEQRIQPWNPARLKRHAALQLPPFSVGGVGFAAGRREIGNGAAERSLTPMIPDETVFGTLRVVSDILESMGRAHGFGFCARAWH